MTRYLIGLGCLYLPVILGGCAGGAVDNGEQDLDTYRADGSWESGESSLSFELPARFYVYVPPRGAEATQVQSLLASDSLTGLQGPEVRVDETTRVPLTFDLRGSSEIQVASWRVEIRNQVTGATQSQSKQVTAGDSAVVILFTGLPAGRYDTTLELYGTGSAGDGSGSLVFELEVLQDTR
ncbi:MAG: hypothetical protein GF320_14095 [Armatimonadia bacterium]|nr:hypothetical protein [Armatimonadia bacterium]